MGNNGPERSKSSRESRSRVVLACPAEMKRLEAFDLVGGLGISAKIVKFIRICLQIEQHRAMGF